MATRRDSPKPRSNGRVKSTRPGRLQALQLTGRGPVRVDPPPAERRPAERPPARQTLSDTAPSNQSDGPHLDGPTDPRWVLAVRTADQLEGAILRPEKRERLIRLARTMGLTPFDANLIIAIVQDQARRGYQPEYCPTAGESQLAMVPAPSAARRLTGKLQNRQLLITTALVLIVVGLEAVVVKWLFF